MSSSLPEIAKMDLFASIDEMDDILDNHQETSADLPQRLLNDINTACSDIEEAVRDQSLTNADLAAKTREKTALVKQLSKQMRSL